MKNDLFYAGLITIALGVSLFVIAPFAVIWSLNELFQFNIAYTFWNWVAMFVLLVSVNASITKKGK